MTQKHRKRAESAWNQKAPIRWRDNPDRTRTNHAAAREYAKQGWGKYETREAWQDSLRFKGVMTL